MDVKPIGDVVKKFIEVTPQRAGYYEAATKGKGGKMEANAIAAVNTFKSAVSAGNIGLLYTGGLKGSAAKFDRRVGEVGSSRFSEGTSKAGPDYNAGVAPYLEELARINLGTRAPRGSASNLERVRVIMTQLHAKRLMIRGAGA